MNIVINFSDVNWISVTIVTIISFVLGALWHSKLLFGKAWKEDVGPDFDEKKIKFVPLFGLTAIFHFIAFTALDLFIGKDAMISDGLIKGAFVGIAWIGAGIEVTYLFAQRPVRLMLIDAGFYIVLFSIAGIILAL